jgi:hypothetical protein
MNTQLLKQVSKDEKEALKNSFVNNPLILKALRSYLDDMEKEVIINLSSAELLSSANYNENLTAMLAELRTYRKLKEVING